MILIFWKFDLYGFGIDKIASILWFFRITATIFFRIINTYSKLAKPTLRIIRMKGQTQASNHQQ